MANVKGTDKNTAAEMEAEAIDAIEASDLDHLLKTALPTNPATDIHADSALGELMGAADMDTYSRATDSLEALSAKLDAIDALNLTKRVTKSVTFDGGAGSGAVGTVNLFTVTGGVDVSLEAFCTTLLTEAGATATIEIGISGNTAFIIAQTNAVDIDADEIWHDATPDSTIELTSDASKDITIYGSNIIATIGTQNITAGVIEFSVLYTPRTSGASLVEAA